MKFSRPMTGCGKIFSPNARLLRKPWQRAVLIVVVWAAAMSISPDYLFVAACLPLAHLSANDPTSVFVLAVVAAHSPAASDSTGTGMNCRHCTPRRAWR
jgi:hypothetical protein